MFALVKNFLTYTEVEMVFYRSLFLGYFTANNWNNNTWLIHSENWNLKGNIKQLMFSQNRAEKVLIHANWVNIRTHVHIRVTIVFAFALYPRNICDIYKTARWIECPVSNMLKYDTLLLIGNKTLLKLWCITRCVHFSAHQYFSIKGKFKWYSFISTFIWQNDSVHW